MNTSYELRFKIWDYKFKYRQAYPEGRRKKLAAGVLVYYTIYTNIHTSYYVPIWLYCVHSKIANTIVLQWDFDNGYTNYSENEIDLATVLMNLKEDYPSHISCDNHEEAYYHQTANSGEQQQWQPDPSNQHQHHHLHGQQRVFAVYDSLQDNSNHVRPTDENYLLPAVLGIVCRSRHIGTCVVLLLVIRA